MTVTTRLTSPERQELLRAVAHLLALSGTEHGLGEAWEALGQTLVDSDPDGWGVPTVAEALRLVAPFRADLARSGFHLPQGRPGPREVAALFEDRPGRTLVFDAPPVADPVPVTPLVVSAQVVSGAIEIRLSRVDPVCLAELRAIPGRRFVDGVNLVPLPAADAVVGFLRRHGAVVPAALLGSTSSLSAVECTITLSPTHLCLAFPAPPAESVRQCLKDAVPGIAYEAGVWRVHRGHGAAVGVARFVAETGAIVHGDLAAILRSVDSEAMRASRASRATDAEIVVPGFARDLRSFQRATVAYAVDRRRCLIGDDMGLGKTTSALATLACLDGFPTLVMCQASMKLAWRKEVAACLPDRTCEVVFGARREAIPAADVTIVNYELVARRLDDLSEVEPRSLVLDEIQAFKGASAQRTKAAHRLAAEVRARRDIILGLSGTPLLSRPAELIESLKLLGRLDDFGGWRGFTSRYCAAKRVTHNRDGDTHWDISGSDNLVELHEKMRSVCFVRHAKADVLGELPPLETVEVPLSNLDRAKMAEYAQAESDLADYVAARAREAGTDEMAAVLRALAAETLVQRTAMRRLIGEAKVIGACEWIADFLADAEGEKLIVFGWHQEVVKAIAAHFDVPALVGGMTPARIEEVKDRFQTDPARRLLVANIKVGGTGHGLTAASHMAFVEEPWTPSELSQACARAFGRLSDVHGLTAWHLTAPGTIDDDILDLVSKKAGIVSAVIDGRVPESDGEDGGVVIGVLRRLTDRHAVAVAA